MTNIGRMHNYATIAGQICQKVKKNIYLWLIHATGFNALYSRDNFSTILMMLLQHINITHWLLMMILLANDIHFAHIKF